jgi:hypothetical protein
MLIRTFVLCATLLATGCIAVPVGPDYYGDGYYSGGGYAPSYYSGTVVYRDERPRRYYYQERDRHHGSHRYDGKRRHDHDDRDRRDRHGRAWD